MENKLYQGKDVLDVMHNYAVKRNNRIEKLVRLYINNSNSSGEKNICEFGAGSGEFINRFSNEPLLKTYAVEIDENYLSGLSRDHITYNNLDQLQEKLDLIFSIDVLEHIDNDLSTLRQIFNGLKKNGLLLLYVPARQELYSKFDERIGHYRRYHKAELEEKVKTAGFTIINSRYDDFLGYFAAWYNKYTTDGTLNPKAVRIYDKIFVPISSFIEKIVVPPIGKNLLLVAKK